VKNTRSNIFSTFTHLACQSIHIHITSEAMNKIFSQQTEGELKRRNSTIFIFIFLEKKKRRKRREGGVGGGGKVTLSSEDF
jgi:hypothetical protein